MAFKIEESDTYQMILERGYARGVPDGVERGIPIGVERGIPIGVERGIAQGFHRLIERQATKRFGPPPVGGIETLWAINDHERLERLADRVLDATSWDDLLATP